MTALSTAGRAEFLAPPEKLKRQVFRALQNFRDQLSERTTRAFGVPLRTTETEIQVEEPRAPDIHVGRVFDRNWELLSPVVPMILVRGLVERHFAGKVPYMVEKNLSRLASQWEESVRAAMAQVEKIAERRLDELVDTVERLVMSGRDEAPRIRADLARIASALDEIGAEASQGAAG